MNKIVRCITPTGGRYDAIALAQKYMHRQSFHEYEWIVLDDCDPASEVGKDDPRITVLRPQWRWSKARNTQADNMVALLDYVLASDCEYLLVIEDDEWYAADYVGEMIDMLDRHPDRIIVGESNCRFYNVRLRHAKSLGNMVHTALCRTGVTREGMRLMRDVFAKPIPHGVAHDQVLWDQVEPSRKLIFDKDRPMNIGIKGMPGRFGIGSGHDRIKGKVIVDNQMSLLRTWIGEDADHYAKYFQQSSTRQ